MVSFGYSKINVDYYAYFKTFLDGRYNILMLYMDDILIVEHDATLISSLGKGVVWLI